MALIDFLLLELVSVMTEISFIRPNQMITCFLDPGWSFFGKMQKKKGGGGGGGGRGSGCVKCNGRDHKHMPKWPPFDGSVSAYSGSELPIKQRRVVKCSWEDIGCILEKLGQPEATITKIEISASEKFADPVHAGAPILLCKQFKGGLHLKPSKFEHIFVAVITFFPFLLCKYF